MNNNNAESSERSDPNEESIKYVLTERVKSTQELRVLEPSYKQKNEAELELARLKSAQQSVHDNDVDSALEYKLAGVKNGILVDPNNYE